MQWKWKVEQKKIKQLINFKYLHVLMENGMRCLGEPLS